MKASEFRAEARKKLDGKWKKGVLISLTYIATFFLIGFIEALLFPKKMEDFLSIVNTIIEVPLIFGTISAFLKLYNNEDVKAFSLVKIGFSNFSKAWKIFLRMTLKMIVPIILSVVSSIILASGIIAITSSAILGSTSSLTGSLTVIIIGFILLIISAIWGTVKSYSYQLANFIAIENPDLTAKEAIEKSAEMMKGHRAKLFFLQLSFIGWALLALFTLGIGYLWLLPYMQFAIIVFYKSLTDSTAVKTEVIEDDNPIKE